MLHLGATGNAEIIAPVVLAGSFEWPQGIDGIAFPEIDGPIRVSFGASDRVVLPAVDLAKIEAIGWTIPQYFYAPVAARRQVEKFALFMDPNLEPDESTELLRELALYSRWISAGSATILQHEDGSLEDISVHIEPKYASDTVTTISHLFVSKAELHRLVTGQPQNEIAALRKGREQQASDAKNIGHIDRHASRRERMWKAAVYRLGVLHQPKIKAAELVAQIEIELLSRWPDESLLEPKRMMAYITRTLNGDMSHPK